MLEDPEDTPTNRLLSFVQSEREHCAFCKKSPGIKLPFCRVCARMDGVVQLECTYVHRHCAEKHVNRERKIKCPTCMNVMTIVYSGALHDDYALRNIREVFNCCFPSADRSMAFNFIAVKHTLLALLSLGMLIAYTVIAPNATEGGWLIASKVLLTGGFGMFLLSWFISSSSALMYIILYGSIRKAKHQMIGECVLYICVAAVGLVSAIAWKNLLSLETLFGVWSIIVSLAILSIVIISVIEKFKTFSGLTTIGITMQVIIDE